MMISFSLTCIPLCNWFVEHCSYISILLLLAVFSDSFGVGNMVRICAGDGVRVSDRVINSLALWTHSLYKPMF